MSSAIFPVLVPRPTLFISVSRVVFELYFTLLTEINRVGLGIFPSLVVTHGHTSFHKLSPGLDFP